MNFTPSFIIRTTLTALVCFTFPAVALALSASGWVVKSETAFVPDGSCGATRIVYDAQARAYDTETVLVPSSFELGSYNTSTLAWVGVTVFGASLTSPIVCHNIKGEALSFRIPGFGLAADPNYYKFESFPMWLYTYTGANGKRLRASVHLRPKTFATEDMAHVSPVGGAAFPSEPSYRIALNSFPRIHGATGLSRVYLFVVDPYGYTWSYSLAASGAEGIKTIAPRGFTTAGTYTWYFYLALNGTGVNELEAPLSAFSGYETFVILPPDLITQNLTRAGTLTVGSTLTFTGSVRNAGTGNAPFGSTARFCIDNPSCLTTSTGQIGTDSTAALAAGAASPTFSHTWVATLGSHTLYMCADVGATVAELNETNNCTSLASFNVIQAPPTVTTLAATTVTTTTAALNGRANPNSAAATGWFRYSTTNPGTCNDSFGTRSPASGGTALGSGTVNINYSSAISDLTGGTTYYYCAIANNSAGNGYGAIASFVSAALPDLMISTNPSLNTGTLVEGNTVTFRGTIMNGGGTAVAGTYNNRFEIDVNNDGSVNVTLTPHPTLANTAAGASGAVTSGSWSNIPAGNHRVILCADNPTPAITELIETNNCSAAGTGLITVAVNSAPNTQTITGPITGDPNINYAFTFTATDPDGDQVRYLIDWDNDGLLDQTLPAGYVNSGTGQSQNNSWAGIGTKTFQARTEDSKGALSGWTSHTITINSPLAVSLTTNPVTGEVSFSDTLTANVSGNISGNIDYYFWWNCNYVGTDIATAESACGSLRIPQAGSCRANGATSLCSQMVATPQDVTNTYTAVGTLTPMVIVQRGGFWAQATTSILATPPPALSVTPGTCDYGNTVVNTTKDASFVVTNTGGGTLTGSFAFPPGPFTCSTANVGGCNFSLTGGNSALFWVTFTPTTFGVTPTYTIDVNSNVPTQTVPVWGSCIPAVSGGALDFGRIIVNSSKDLNLTITNNSAAPMSGTLNLLAPFTCIASSSGMTDTLCNYNFAPRDTNTVTIRFTPPSVGTFSGNTSLSGDPTITFELTGIGYSPLINIIEL